MLLELPVEMVKCFSISIFCTLDFIFTFLNAIFLTSLGCTNGMVKLVGGNDTMGTVLVCQDGFWSMVGDSGWDASEAAVVCGQLGFDMTS